MKAVFTSILALASVALAAPQKRACSSAVSLSGSSNPFASYTLHPNSFYKAEVTAAAASITDSSLKTKASSVANVGSFLWL